MFATGSNAAIVLKIGTTNIAVGNSSMPGVTTEGNKKY